MRPFNLIPALTAPALFLVPAVLFVSRAAFADIYNCNGTWTNKPCGGSPEKTLPEIERPVDLGAEALKKKELLVGNLRLDVDGAGRDYGIGLDISGIEEACRSKDTTYEDCMNLVNNAGDRLSERVNEAKMVKEQEKTNKLLQDGNSGGQDASVVVLDEDDGDIDDDDYVYGRDRDRKRRHHHVDEDQDQREEEGHDRHDIQPPAPPLQQPVQPPAKGKLGQGLQRDPLGRRR